MSTSEQKDDKVYRDLSDNGQITVPAEFRGSEEGYVVEQTEDGRVILVPAQKEERITVAQANEWTLKNTILQNYVN